MHCLFFFFLLDFCTSVLRGSLMKVAHERGGVTATLSGDKVIRAGNNERERKS